LASSTLKEGYKILEELSNELNKKKPTRAKLEILSSEFYTTIPHDFGYQKPPIIETANDIKKKLEMLATIE
jgi:poly [ADP-ribose] polymerase